MRGHPISLSLLTTINCQLFGLTPQILQRKHMFVLFFLASFFLLFFFGTDEARMARCRSQTHSQEFHWTVDGALMWTDGGSGTERSGREVVKSAP